MRDFRRIFANSYLLGDLPKGCKYCVKGAKLVLFLTGRCPLNCWYCTISKARWQKDIVLANERVVKKTSDVVEEAKLQKAMGAGLTGGEPFAVFRRTLNYVKLLKKIFGKKFHLHLYTSGFKVSFTMLKSLQKAGLDEIRFHVTASNSWDVVEEALKLDWDVGIEIPVIPEQEELIKDIVVRADEIGVKFINLNELEVSERNEKILLEKGYVLKENAPTAVEGSEKTALRILKFARKNTKRIFVHYCSAATKNVYQLQNRWKRRARSIKEAYEVIDENGFLVKGVIYSDEPIDDTLY